jgi:hypothetical protein
MVQLSLTCRSRRYLSGVMETEGYTTEDANEPTEFLVARWIASLRSQ